jgi:hypothetical protein
MHEFELHNVRNVRLCHVLRTTCFNSLANLTAFRAHARLAITLTFWRFARFGSSTTFLAASQVRRKYQGL